MRIHALVVTTAETPDQPSLIDAWDAVAVEDSPEGWRTVVNEVGGLHVLSAAEIVIDVPHDAIMAELRREPPTVQANITQV